VPQATSPQVASAPATSLQLDLLPETSRFSRPRRPTLPRLKAPQATSLQPQSLEVSVPQATSLHLPKRLKVPQATSLLLL
jgi:hypothetical protein